MVRQPSIAGKWALVTGASSGLGADFARELAARGAHLVLVARRTDRLNELSEEIRNRHQIKVEVITADLSAPQAAQSLYNEISARVARIDILINNAGLGLYGQVWQIPWAREEAMLQTDVVTLAGLTSLYLPEMLARRSGYILNVSSIAAFQPTPLYASYAGAKAFVLYYTQALHHELRGSGVHASVVAPGVTATEFLEVAGQKASPYQRLTMMQSKDVVRRAIDGLLAGKQTIIPGFVNAAVASVARISPAWLSSRVAQALMQSNTPQH